MPIPLVSAVCPGEANAFFPEHLQNVRAVTESPVVAPGPRQPDALYAEVLRQERAGLAHLFAGLLGADTAHDTNRPAIFDVDRLEELMGVRVLLDVEERVAGDGLKLWQPTLERLTDDEQRGRRPKAVVERSRLLEKPWREVPLAQPLDVVADQHRAHTRTSAVNHFTLPAVSPAMKWRCSATNMITIGMLASSEPAITIAGWFMLPWRSTIDSQSWTVNLSSLRRNTSGCRKSFQDERKTKIASEARAGRITGSTMREKMPNSPAPSTRAASRSSSGTERQYCRIQKMPKALAIPGMISARYVSTQPMHAMMMKLGINPTPSGIIIVVRMPTNSASRPRNRSLAKV